MRSSAQGVHMHRVMVVGLGKIGSAIACLLIDSGAYQVHLVDVSFEGNDVKRLLNTFPKVHCKIMDIKRDELIQSYLKSHKIEAVISCLPYHLNYPLAVSAKKMKVHYFDLTEDIATTTLIKKLAKNAKTALVPQCGLAPGFTNIVANALMNKFDDCNEVKLRVGALPQNAHNKLLYALTWSTEGLINEYGNLCEAIVDGKQTILMPLEALETLELEGCLFEAFNTSGGLGSLVELAIGKVQNLSYKTIRYPGHCEKMHFLMNDLRLNQDREMLKTLLEGTIPRTYQDKVYIYVTVNGKKYGEFIEEGYYKTILPKHIAGISWSAIQIATSAGICAVVDIILNNTKSYTGFVYQEQLSLDDFLDSRFGIYFKE